MANIPLVVPVPVSLGTLPAIDDKGRLLAVIEAAAGSRNKLKFDPATGVLALHTMLPLGASFPYAFGFVPSTLGEDGDPLDVMVFLDEQVPPGVVVRCRLVGVILATQTKDGASMRNDRLLAVADKSHHTGVCKRWPTWTEACWTRSNASSSSTTLRRARSSPRSGGRARSAPRHWCGKAPGRSPAERRRVL